MTLPSYEEVCRSLETFGFAGTPAEAHGLLVAFFCCGVNLHVSAWIDSIKSEFGHLPHEVKNQAQETLTQLFTDTQTMLSGEEYAFQLLLPMDESLFEERLSALTEWCQGFLAGLNLMGVKLSTTYGDEIDEALSDMTKISCLAVENEIADETNETALTELVEYARVAVMLLRDAQGRLLDNQKTVVKH